MWDKNREPCGRCLARDKLWVARKRQSACAGRLSGSRDETVRVWSVTLGHAVTLFDVHAAVCNVIITSDAGRILVRTADGCHVPFLCLHNSPAAAAAAAASSVRGGQNHHVEPQIVVAGQFI